MRVRRPSCKNLVTVPYLETWDRFFRIASNGSTFGNDDDSSVVFQSSERESRPVLASLDAFQNHTTPVHTVGPVRAWSLQRSRCENRVIPNPRFVSIPETGNIQFHAMISHRAAFFTLERRLEEMNSGMTYTDDSSQHFTSYSFVMRDSRYVGHNCDYACCQISIGHGFGDPSFAYINVIGCQVRTSRVRNLTIIML